MPATLTRRIRRTGLALAVILAVYMVMTLDGLTRLPPVHDDEMWNAAPAAKLATTGVYGSDLFAGLHHADHRTYQFMPMLQLLLAAAFRVFGVGLLQIRLVSVAAGAVLVVLTFLLGRRVGGPSVGLLAAGLLVGARLATGSLDTGLVLVDSVRVVRYHLLVPIFGLGGLLVFERAEARPGPRPATLGYMAAGALCGLSYLSHVYGVFWLPALWGALLVRRGLRAAVWSRQSRALAGGFILAIVPWLVYVLSDLGGFLGQMSMYRERFAVLDPGFYLRNVLNEPYRYAGFGVRDLLTFRPGAWFAIGAGALAVPASCRSVWRRPTDPIGAALIPLVTFAVLYALLLQRKTFVYLLNLLPLALVLVSWHVGRWWEAVRGRGRHLVLAAVLLVVAADGVGASVARHRRVLRATGYSELIGRLRPYVPPGALIVGPPRFWMGFPDHAFRAWNFIAQLGDRGADLSPAPMGEVLARVRPGVLIFDRSAFLEPEAGASRWQWQYSSIVEYLRAHGGRRVLALDDPTWGLIEVHVLDAEPAAARR